MLADELLGELDLAAPLERRPVPEPVLVGGPERVDDHQLPGVVDAELLFPVDVEEPARSDLRLHRGVDLQDHLLDPVDLLRVELAQFPRLGRRQQAVDRLELGGHLEERLREPVALRDRLPGGEPELGGPDRARLHPVPERPGDVVPDDELERNEVVLRVGAEGLRLRYDLHPLDPHRRRAGEREEVVGDAEAAAQPEPVGGGPVERLALVGDLRRDVLVEHRDVVGEPELELLRGDLEHLLDLPAAEELRRGRRGVGGLGGGRHVAPTAAGYKGSAAPGTGPYTERAWSEVIGRNPRFA